MKAFIVGLELDRAGEQIVTIRVEAGELMFDTFKVPVAKLTQSGAVGKLWLGESVELVTVRSPSTEKGGW